MFEKEQMLMSCRIAPLTKDRYSVVMFDIKEGQFFCSSVLDHITLFHKVEWFLISQKFTARQVVLYFHEQSEIHITWNLYACAPLHLTFVHCAPRSMKYHRMQPIKAAWEPAAPLSCHWEWTVGLVLIGREPESHLHLGQAALALNPHAPPFLPLGSSSARLPALLQRAATGTSFTPTDVWRRGSNTPPAKRQHPNQSNILTCREIEAEFFTI